MSFCEIEYFVSIRQPSPGHPSYLHPPLTPLRRYCEYVAEIPPPPSHLSGLGSLQVKLEAYKVVLKLRDGDESFAVPSLLFFTAWRAAFFSETGGMASLSFQRLMEKRIFFFLFGFHLALFISRAGYFTFSSTTDSIFCSPESGVTFLERELSPRSNITTSGFAYRMQISFSPPLKWSTQEISVPPSLPPFS